MIRQHSYYRVVIGLYAVIVPLVVSWKHEQLSFRVDWYDTVLIVFAIAAFSLVGKKWLISSSAPVRNRVLIAALVHGFLFAIPEEILFRGIVQTWLQAETASATVSLILASLLFGIAHIFNGAQGWLPRQWNWRLAGVAFLGGLLFGSAYLISDSLTLPIFLHAGMVTLLNLRQQSKNPPGEGRVR